MIVYVNDKGLLYVEITFKKPKEVKNRTIVHKPYKRKQYRPLF